MHLIDEVTGASEAQRGLGNSANVRITNAPLTLNPAATFNRPADILAYAVGDLVANSTVAGSVLADVFPAARAPGGSFSILRARLRKSGVGVAAAAFRLHLFAVSPTVASGDNGAFMPAQSASYIGSIDVATMQAFSDGSVGAGVPTVGQTLEVDLPAGQSIYGLTEARGAYTPVSAETFAWTLELSQH